MTKLSLALLVALPTMACVDPATDTELPDTADEVASALEQENGGLTMDDEAPEFGAEALFAAAAIEPDAAESDPMAPEVTAMEGTPGARVRSVLLLWGSLPVDPSATDVRDWSGQLALDRGGMMIHRRIAFEQALGDRIRPRTDRAVIEFVSRTRPAADGLVLTIVDPSPGTGPLTLTYTPADGSEARVFALPELADGPLVVDAGNGDKIIASAKDIDPCDHGVMRGRWQRLGARGGIYLGVVRDDVGAPLGHVRGIWGTRLDGTQVFFGKFVDLAGHFRGILAGQFDAGRFEGRWLTRAAEHGRLAGVYFDHDELRGGGFVARWGETSCRAQ